MNPWKFLFAVALCSLPVLHAQEVRSPDGALTVDLQLRDGALSYRATLNGAEVIEPSPLGLETSLGSFSRDLTATGSATRTIDEHYTLPHGKVRTVHYRANELVAHFTNADGHAFDVIFRVSDRDVAFAYRIHGKQNQRITVLKEVTAFDFPADTTAYVTPQAKPGTGWMASKPSYEEHYLVDVPIDTPSPFGLGFTFPALFRVGTNWALVSETGLSSRYAGTRLSDPTSEGSYTIAFPHPEENAGQGDAVVHAPLPLLTPWRTLTISDNLAAIVESTVATDVVEPLYEASQTYEPGRTTWSWLVWQDPSMNEADQRTFIDLAAKMGYEYILVDALWDANIGRERMAQLVAEASRKGVDVILWYNSNGTWNDAPQTPRNLMDNAPARHQEMAWLRSIGVKGLKVDFFGGDKQTTIKLYEDILTDANRYGLMLNFHGATLPRGWERMYPNFMTSEAVLSSENLVFTQDFADREAFHSTLHPFIRNAVAPMDFGPVLLNRILSRDQKDGTRRRTTDAFQLATAVLYQSPLQHLGLTPNNLDEQPEFVLEFLKKVPSVWDETRFVDGHPGRFVALARRSGETWYLVATNAESEPKDLTINADFLAGKEVQLIEDGPDGRAQHRTLRVPLSGEISLNLATGGGAVVFQ